MKYTWWTCQNDFNVPGAKEVPASGGGWNEPSPSGASAVTVGFTATAVQPLASKFLG
jgi:hypothetical protein